ncbi:hypothetical protein QTP88_009020 [Uroleucon formosanum]
MTIFPNTTSRDRCGELWGVLFQAPCGSCEHNDNNNILCCSAGRLLAMGFRLDLKGYRRSGFSGINLTKVNRNYHRDIFYTVILLIGYFLSTYGLFNNCAFWYLLKSKLMKYYATGNPIEINTFGGRDRSNKLALYSTFLPSLLIMPLYYLYYTRFSNRLLKLLTPRKDYRYYISTTYLQNIKTITKEVYRPAGKRYQGCHPIISNCKRCCRALSRMSTHTSFYSWNGYYCCFYVVTSSVFTNRRRPTHIVCINNIIKDKFFGFHTNQLIEMSTNKNILINDFLNFLNNAINYLNKWFDFSDLNWLKQVKCVNLSSELKYSELLNLISELKLENKLFLNMNELYDECNRINETLPLLKEPNSNSCNKWQSLFKITNLENNNFYLKNIYKVVSFIYSIPATSSYCERVFSMMNLKYRNERNKCRLELIKYELIITLNAKETCTEIYDTFLKDEKLLKAAKKIM